LPSYQDRLLDLAEEEGVAVICHRIPIRDMSIPTDDSMRRILRLIDACLYAKRPVYIHCLGGRGRTGTVVGCYLAQHGYAKSLKALDLINALRKDTVNRDKPSPETPEQIRMVLRWQ
jgi:protein-tyrosine phosphatase